jgi:glycine cleavage system transcriptional repressor
LINPIFLGVLCALRGDSILIAIGSCSMMNQFIISVLSRDQIGIVAEVSGAISQLQGDIADLRQSVLCGYLTMLLVATFPEEQSADRIRQRLAALNQSTSYTMDIVVRPVENLSLAEAALPEQAYVLTASGKDRIGFVSTVTAFCARNGLNILDLSTAVADGSYTMMLLIDLRAADIGEIRRQLQQFGRDTGFNVVLQHEDIFKATHEVGKV